MSTNTMLFGVLFALVAICLFFLVRIEMRLKKLFRGTKAANLEGLMADIAREVDDLGKRAGDHSLNIQEIENRLSRHGRGVKLLRFNPFTDVGGNQSFAVAIMNEAGDGVVFSSLYSRERMSVFAKPVSAGKSDIELTPEEQAVVADAQKEAKN